MDVRKEVEFFDQVVAEHGDSEVLSEEAYERAGNLFARWIIPVAGETCLDLACGTGAFTRRLRPFGFRLTGIDISPASVARARSMAAGEQYVLGDIRATGYPERSVDVIAYSGVLHHCPTPAERVRVLSEGFRVLRPGGRVFAYDPSGHSPSMIAYRSPRSPFFSRAGKTENEVLLDRSALRLELESVGFSDIRIRGVAGMTFRHVEGRIARTFLPLYNLYERFLAHTPLEARFGTFLFTTAKRPLT